MVNLKRCCRDSEEADMLKELMASVVELSEGLRMEVEVG